jgi:hypothetical protein
MGGTAAVTLQSEDYSVGKRTTKIIPSHRIPGCHEDIGPGRPDPCIEPPENVSTYDNPLRPDSLYVRAFARTAFLATPYQCLGVTPDGDAARRTGKCIERLAYTNPIWAKRPFVFNPGGNWGWYYTSPSVGYYNGF